MQDEAELTALRENCRAELLAAERPRCVYKLGELNIEGDVVRLCGLQIGSASLAAHLQDCEQAYLFAATLGGDVDRLIARFGAQNMSKSYIADVLASQRIEAYCDEAQQALQTKGKFMRPRFSPGYGDFALEMQPALLQALDAQRAIGLFCTKGGMLAPVKSVTAVIGLCAKEQGCHIHKCAACGKKDCVFRKESGEIGT